MTSLQEEAQKPKALVMAGSGGSGKSYVVDQLNIPEDLEILNPDKYIEGGDMSLGSLGAASRKVSNDLKDKVERGESFVYDTTASNPDTIKNFVDKGYDVMMVMVYTHPVVSLMSNFERDRKLPFSAVFSTWDKVYSLIETYKSMLGSSFFLVDNTRKDKYSKLIDVFNKAASKGAKGILQFIENLTNTDPDKFKTTFEKPFEIEDVEAKRSYDEEVAGLDATPKEEKKLMKYFMDSWKKKQVGPGQERMAKKLDSIRKESKKSKETMLSTMESISEKLETITSDIEKDTSSISQVKSKVQGFLNG